MVDCKLVETFDSIESAPGSMCLSEDKDDCERMESIYSKMADSGTSADNYNELQIYLSEKPELRVENPFGFSYDPLDWWKRNFHKYPILSELARDVLAIQASSVDLESASSTSGRVLDSYRSALTPYMVEFLLCIPQWRRRKYKA